MKLIRESYNQPTVGEIRKILQNAIDDLSDYDDGVPVKVENNTYYVKGRNFLGITSVGYVDFDNMVDDTYASGDFVEKVSTWYDDASYNTRGFKEVEAILNRLDPNEEYELITDILNDKATEDDLNEISRLTGISR